MPALLSLVRTAADATAVSAYVPDAVDCVDRCPSRVSRTRECGRRRREERDRQEKEKGRKKREDDETNQRMLACLIKQERSVESKSVR